jgi:hypothetical protein
MLAIEGGDYLTGVEVRKRDDWDFREPEFFPEAGRHAAEFRIADAAAQAGCDFDSYLRRETSTYAKSQRPPKRIRKHCAVTAECEKILETEIRRLGPACTIAS